MRCPGDCSLRGRAESSVWRCSERGADTLKASISASAATAGNRGGVFIAMDGVRLRLWHHDDQPAGRPVQVVASNDALLSARARRRWPG